MTHIAAHQLNKVAAAVVFLAAGSIALARSNETPITTAAEVRQLSPEDARKELPVSIRGVVTYVNVETGELFVQDKSAGIFVFIRNSTSDVALRAGQRVTVTGVTAPGDFASSVTKARISVAGEGEMPNSVRLPFEEIFTGEQDSQWGHLVGVVRSGREESGVLYLNAVTTGGEFLIILKEHPADWATTLVDSKVSLDGVLAAVFNEHRQAAGVRIFVPLFRLVHIDEPAPVRPFDLPESSVLSIGIFRAKQDWSHRIRVRANVTAAVSQNLIYASAEQANLAVELWKPCSGKVGALVDFVGFPGTIDGRPGLKNAICRVVPGGMLVPPAELPARDVVPPQTAEDGSGLSIAKGTRNDLRLITVAGIVIQVAKGLLSQTLTLVAEDQTFSVTLPASGAWTDSDLEPATRLKVTGVCLVTFDEYHQASSFRLLARNAGDIIVISRPSWFTLNHAFSLLAALVFLIAGSMVWISVLRRHVTTKTLELRAAVERLRQLSDEDALTGAANRRRFDDKIEDELKRCQCDAAPLSLIMIDIDHFKQVNDTYGHKGGDQYLIQVVGELRRVLAKRRDALIARYGGDEFAVLLPNTGQDGASGIAEEIRAAVEHMAIPCRHPSPELCQGLSLGVAALAPGSAFESGQLVNMADRALYEAKHRGRNRVAVFDASAQAECRATEVLSKLSTVPG